MAGSSKIILIANTLDALLAVVDDLDPVVDTATSSHPTKGAKNQTIN
jgi:hypothetical protein